MADRVSFIQGDVFKADFNAATVVTMYLLDNVNLRLRPRILNELRPGTRIISHQFHMFDWPPDNTVMVLDQVPVHFWVVPAKVQGSWHGKIGDDAVALDLAQKFQLVTGDLAVGDARGRIAQAKMTGDILALEGSVTRSGKAEPLRFEGKVTKKALTGTLTLGGAAHSVALQRAAESSR